MSFFVGLHFAQYGERLRRHVVPPGVLGVTRMGALRHRARQRQQVEKIGRQTGLAAQPAVIAVLYAERRSPERANPLGPQPGVLSGVGQMPRQLFLNVLILGVGDEPQDQVRAAQLRIPVIVEQQNLIGILLHLHTSTSRCLSYQSGRLGTSSERRSARDSYFSRNDGRDGS